MSATDFEVATCAGKARFDNVTIARKASQRSRRSHDEPIQPYKCPHCGGWHLGTSKKANRIYASVVRRARGGKGGGFQNA